MAERRRWEAFRVVSVLAAALFVGLFVQLLFTPGALCEGFGLAPSEAVFVLERRVSMLMLGVAVLLLGAQRAPPSPVRRAISLGAALSFAGFACTGSYEVLRGAMKPSVWGAVAVEVAFAVAFLALGIADGRALAARAREADREEAARA